MSRTTKLIITDDFDGTVIDEPDYKSLQFAIDGAIYEIDVNADHRGEFMEMLAPWCEAATEMPKKFVGRSTARLAAVPSMPGQAPKRPTRRDPVQVAAIRQWGRANGYEISDRGRIPREVEDAYNARNGRAS